jgi:ArsR family transcriptional regulator
MVSDGERPVAELAEHFAISRPSVSEHLKVLKDAGLVYDRKEGRWSYYSIVPNALDEAHDLVIAFLPKDTSGTRTLRVAGSREMVTLKSACCR